MPTFNCLTQPEMCAFLATLEPDPELVGAAEGFSRADALLSELRERATVVAADLAAIDGAYLDAALDRRKTLVEARALLSAELAIIPGRLREAGQRSALAELAYLARAATLIGAAHDRAAVAYTVAFRPLGEVLSRMTQVDCSLQHRDEKNAALAELDARRAALAATVAPLRRRVDAARQAHSVARALAQLAYGDDADIRRSERWGRAATAYGARLARRPVTG